MVLIIGPNEARGSRGGVPLDQGPLYHVAGTALDVEQRPFVLTTECAFMDMVDYWRKYRDGPPEVWALPAHLFQQLAIRDRHCRDELRKKGAVQASGCWSFMVGFRRPAEFPKPGMDTAMVELAGPLSGLPPNPPHVLSKKQPESVRAFLMEQKVDSIVKIRIAGLTAHTSLTLPSSKGNALKVC